jgi:hypothetical protein
LHRADFYRLNQVMVKPGFPQAAAIIVLSQPA